MVNRENEGLYAEFHLHPVLQVEESKKQNREVYKDELYIKIQIKGQKNQIRARKVRPEDKHEFPNAWARWLEQNEEIKDGTPVTMLPGVTPAFQLELKTLGVRTVEDLAKLTDAACTNMRGGYMFRQRAQAYLAAAAVTPETMAAPAGEQPETESEFTSDDPVDVDAMKSDPTVVPAPPHNQKRKRS